jgi:hypothetical protein
LDRDPKLRIVKGGCMFKRIVLAVLVVGGLGGSALLTAQSAAACSGHGAAAKTHTT